MYAMKARILAEKNIAETLPAFCYPYKYVTVCKKSESPKNQNVGWQRNIGNTGDKLKGKATKNVIPSQSITPFVRMSTIDSHKHKITYAGHTHQVVNSLIFLLHILFS